MTAKIISQRLCHSLCVAGVIHLLLAIATTVEAASTRDKVRSYEAALQGNATYTASGGGRTGATNDYAMDLTPQGGYANVADASFLNAATANDELTIALWVKKYDIAQSSAFWVESPQQARVFQAHTPWNNNVIYFDTGGIGSSGTQTACCGVETRIESNIDQFPGFSGDTTDISWWTNNWHLFVFTKKADLKQVWIDGQFFIEGSNVAKLATDIGYLNIGAANGGGGQMHGLIDDFSIYSKALTESQITNLFAGTLPTAAALGTNAGLIAYWDFNDFSAEGIISSTLPPPNSTTADPNLIQVVHRDGIVAWTTNNVSLKVDNNPVTITFTKVGDTATVRHVPNPFFAAQTKHTATLTYPDAAGAPKTMEWQFTVAVYTKDVVQSRIGVLRGSSSYTDSGGGRTSANGDYGMDLTRLGGYVGVPDATFLNQATANDELTIALWVKKYDNANSSAFWVASPTQARVFQAHTPWSDNVIYFDSGGIGAAGTQTACCGAETRISSNIDQFPDYTGDISWWTNNWHFFVFSKKADLKQVWIDGKFFIEGNNGAIMPTNISILNLGADNAGGNLMHGLVDDYSIYSTALTETQITNLYAGTLPTALAGNPGLLAYWNFNDLPDAGYFVSVSPTPDSTNALPNLIRVVHKDGASTIWDTNKVSLRVDNVAVTPTVTRSGGLVTVSYVPSPIFAGKSTHSATLLYDGVVAREWQFTVTTYTTDLVRGSVGALTGAAQYSPNGGGKSGSTGDYAMDLMRTGGYVAVSDASYLSTATASDELSIAMWIKRYDVANSSAFWIVAGSQARAFQAHAPYSDGNIYFDTSGAVADVSRIFAHMDTFTDYTGDIGYWTNSWRLLVFSKKVDVKQIWIDGKLFLEGNNTAVLPPDITIMNIGADNAGGGRMHALVDDFSVYSKALTENQITNLFNGTLPTALAGSPGLLAYWNFNDVPASNPTIVLEKVGGSVRLTYTGTLQSTSQLGTTWVDVAGANSPYTIAPVGTVFYRSRR